MVNRFFLFNNVILVLGIILFSTSVSQALPDQDSSLIHSRNQFLRGQGTVSLEKENTLPLPALPKPDQNFQLRQSRDGFLNPASRKQGSLFQVTSVSELPDISPTEWSDEALREDIEKLKRLGQEFEQELMALGARVSNLESRVAYLEDHQFSTTTVLSGEFVIALTGIPSGDKNGGTEEINKVNNFGYRGRLEFNTSFDSNDLLYTRFATGTIPAYSDITGTFEGGLDSVFPEDSDLAIDLIIYEFDLAENVRVFIEPVRGFFDDFVPTVNFLDGDGASEGNDPALGAGMFNGPYGVIRQFAYNPSDNFKVAFTYVHGYNNLDSETGTRRANFQSFIEEEFEECDDRNDDLVIGTIRTTFTF